MENWEWEEEILGSLLFEALVILVPLGAFKVETVDKHALINRLNYLAFNAAVITGDDFFLHLSLVVDLIEGPELVSVLTGDLLLHRGKETLRVEEAGQPEGWWALTVG